jgi:hypothetical protein
MLVFIHRREVKHTIKNQLSQGNPMQLTRYALVITLLAASATAPRTLAEKRPLEPNLLTNAWTPALTAPLLAKTMRLRLPYDPSSLAEAERKAVVELIAAGERMHRMYLDQRHHQALAAAQQLARLTVRQDLQDLFRVMKGPVVTTLDNKRVPLLGVDAELPGKNVYPLGVTQNSMDTWLAQNPQRREEV